MIGNLGAYGIALSGASRGAMGAGRGILGNPTAMGAIAGGIAGGVMGDGIGGAAMGAGIGALGGRFGAGRGYGSKLAGAIGGAGGRMYRGGFGMMEGSAARGYAGMGLSGLGQGMSRFGNTLAANGGFYGDVALSGALAGTAGLIGNSMMSSNRGY